jgi:hypothetical protein
MARRARRGPVPLLLLGLAVCTAPRDAGGAEARDVPQVFTIAKSENQNRVAYGVRLDERCAPVGDAPVYAYWRMLERSAGATEPLLSREEPAYGMKRQRVEGGVAKILLRGLADREIWIEPAAIDGRCTARAWTRIAGKRAELVQVFVQLRWPFGVAHLRVKGRTPAGTAVEELIEP